MASTRLARFEAVMRLLKLGCAGSAFLNFLSGYMYRIVTGAFPPDLPVTNAASSGQSWILTPVALGVLALIFWILEQDRSPERK